MNGAGNDFIIINNIKDSLGPEALSRLAKALCRRRLSIGADGLMAVCLPTLAGADFRMLFYNADGSLGEMCGNGARCICRYGYETGLSGPTQRVETTAGLVTGRRIDRRQYEIRLNDPTLLDLHVPVTADWRRYNAAYVELGSPGLPHAVVPYPGLDQADEEQLRRLGREIRFYSAFPKGANVDFYEQTGPNQVAVRTYERGVEDFTLACGTGAGAVAAVLTAMSAAERDTWAVHMPGGTLTVYAEKQPRGRISPLLLTGPTNIVAKGTITDEEL